MSGSIPLRHVALSFVPFVLVGAVLAILVSPLFWMTTVIVVEVAASTVYLVARCNRIVRKLERPYSPVRP